MSSWTDFETVFRPKLDYTLDSKQVDAITRHRKELGGTLFFDRIWTSIGLKQAQKSYPPKTNADLRALWQKIVKAEVSDEKKQALLYYVLRDCRQPSNINAVFAQRVYLPLKYQTLVTGLWELDHLQFSRALEHLTDPGLAPEFADDILSTLLTAPKCDRSLAMAYYVTVQPPLATSQVLLEYFRLLANTSIIEAYHFCKERGPNSHRTLFEALIRISHEESDSADRARRLTTLLSLPFTTVESEWFEQYLSKGNGSRLPGANDAIIMRRLVAGEQLAGVKALDSYHGEKIEDINWDDIRTLDRAVA